ncbi:type VI secretion system tube protein Hcp [Cognatiyoonia sp. IB215182]|uniref:type VI secretion system tube protein Hcp n=1 Tax=Cognatiyoonia sp. IB215182 TaxID=3097353 RepID=UPI002A0C2E63|nr:type VI secretion system tube protein Hcp [Cognatiyoonia sp. IB215182]MDX8355170.1 type VI secretion system tube protein Hcp [Cognatiyoonia sp. IB215182]
MANIYMRIDGINDFKGMASVKEIASKKGFFPVGSFSLGFSRSVFVAVGSAGDAETGVPTLGDVSIQREADSASGILETLFFAPGDKGKTFEIVETKAKNDGSGLIPVQIITMEEARISSYSAAPGSNALTIAFTTLSITHYYEDAAGKVEKGDVVKFDLKLGKLESGNQDAMK